MTGAELITFVRGETLLTTDDVSDAVVLGHLNRGIELVGGRFEWPFLQGEDTFDTVVDQQPYDWPTGAVRIDTIIIDGKRIRLKRVSSKEAWTRYGDNPPTKEARAFYLWNEKIVLLENPPAIITMKVKFYKQPTLMADTSGSPEWNDQYHRFLGEYAISELWRREEDLQQAGVASQKFEDGIQELAGFYNKQAADERAVWGEQPDRYVGAGASNMPWLDGA